MNLSDQVGGNYGAGGRSAASAGPANGTSQEKRSDQAHRNHQA